MKNFNDNYISKLIGIDSNRESIVYSTIIGRKPLQLCFKAVSNHSAEGRIK